ncbi:hypothetical protein OIU34_22925 [Pararhizobium sp. BT-229]|uniref:hypothetical protein n=1 Tax=Pararhizobium sp. BT-229 TaxID=2986923 RepID=UPI0021F7A692|nr:hypothetical protein [Pararhizobium sp. BT-229]MCV9964749.1 hypothetical protein [Pararhizobium sp. BT-229]
MSYIVSGMVSMLRHGVANPGMSIGDLLKVCDEPDLHEYDGDEELEVLWERAKAEFASGDK